MKLRHCTVDEFARRTADKKIICFGAYVMPLSLCNEFQEYHFEDRIVYLADNDEKKHGKDFRLPNGRTRKIISAQQLSEIADKDTVLIITSDYFAAIIEQLDQYKQLDEMHCYIYPFMKYDMVHDKIVPARHSEQPLIPKTIHYFWFGRNPKTELMEKCIDSWKKYCTDYEIIEWNEDNYDVTKHPFMKEAYDAGKYSFVSDFARLDIIYNYGGIYLDTDIEIIKNLEDLLYQDAFAGVDNTWYISLGLGFGARQYHPIIKDLLDLYENQDFDKENMVAAPTMMIPFFEKYGFKANGEYQNIGNMTIYPEKILSGKNNLTGVIMPTDKTFSIHHYDGSWCKQESLDMQKKKHQFYQNAIQI